MALKDEVATATEAVEVAHDRIGEMEQRVAVLTRRVMALEIVAGHHNGGTTLARARQQLDEEDRAAKAAVEGAEAAGAPEAAVDSEDNP